MVHSKYIKRTSKVTLQIVASEFRSTETNFDAGSRVFHAPLEVLYMLHSFHALVYCYLLVERPIHVGHFRICFATYLLGFVLPQRKKKGN